MANEGQKQNAKPPYRDAEPRELEPYVIYDSGVPEILRRPLAQRLAELRAAREVQLTPPQEWLEFCKRYGHDAEIFRPRDTVVKGIYTIVTGLIFLGIIMILALLALLACAVGKISLLLWMMVSIVPTIFIGLITMGFATRRDGKHEHELEVLQKKHMSAPEWICESSERTAKVEESICMRAVSDEVRVLREKACNHARRVAMSEHGEIFSRLRERALELNQQPCYARLQGMPKLAALVVDVGGTYAAECAEINSAIKEVEDIATQCRAEIDEYIRRSREAYEALCRITIQGPGNSQEEYEARLALWEAMKELPDVAERTKANIHAALVEAGYVEDEPEKPANSEPATDPTNLRIVTDTATADDPDELELANAAKPDAAKR